MWQTALNTILTAVAAAGVTVLVAVIKAFGDAGIQFVQTKAAAIEAKAGQDKWNFWITLAKQAWNITEENTRIIPTAEQTIAAKQAEFAVQLKKLIPEITDDEIEQLRQAVAGEVNKGKAAIVGQTQDEQGNGVKVTAPADSTQQTIQNA